MRRGYCTKWVVEEGELKVDGVYLEVLEVVEEEEPQKSVARKQVEVGLWREAKVVARVVSLGAE